MIAEYLIPLLFWSSVIIPALILLFFGSKKLIRTIRHCLYSLWRRLIAAMVSRTLDYKTQSSEIARLDEKVSFLQSQVNSMLANRSLYKVDKSGQISLPLGKLDNHQRITVRLPGNDGIEVYSLDYVDYLNYQNGKTKVERTSYTRDGRNWNKSKKIVWATEDTLSTEDYNYSDNDHCYRDRIIDLDYRLEYVESDNTANNTTPAPVGQLSLFGN